MTRVFEITDRRTEPALLRHFKRAVQSRTEIDRRPTNSLGRPTVGYSPQIWAGYRRYADPVLEGAISSLNDFNLELEVPGVVWNFFGYPRRFPATPSEAAGSRDCSTVCR